MQIGLTVPDNLPEVAKAGAFRAALEASTRAHEALAQAGQLPSLPHVIKAGLVRWQAEPPGQERFDIAPAVMRRGWGDCDDLAPWWAAQLRHTGKDPRARVIVRRTGPKMWHAVVQRSDGSIDDPSLAAGMRAPRGITAPGGPVERAIAITGLPCGRIMAAVQQPHNGAAIVGVGCGWTVKQAARRAHVPHELRGIGFGPLAAALAPAALSVAQPILSKIMPGGGGGAAPTPQGGGGGGGGPHVVPSSGGGGYGFGPVIVRF